MELTDIMKARFSVRKYEKRPVEEEKLRQILEAGMMAPTGKNHQPQRIYVVKSEAGMEKLASVCKCLFGAPMALLVCCKEDEAWHSRFEPGYHCGEMDVSIVTTYMMLKAWELGIGSCWVRYFDSREVARAFELPEGVKPMCILDLGYQTADCEPLATMHDRPRPMAEVITEL